MKIASEYSQSNILSKNKVNLQKISTDGIFLENIRKISDVIYQSKGIQTIEL